MHSHSQHVEQCTWYECLIKPAEDVVTELRFSSMGLDSCHHTFFCMPRSEALLNETFVLFSFIIMSRNGVFSHMPLLFAAELFVSGFELDF